jgi:hypothetical protein
MRVRLVALVVLRVAPASMKMVPLSFYV